MAKMASLRPQPLLAKTMPREETPDQRQRRRSAIRAIGRLSTALSSPDVLSKDAGAAVLSQRVAQLRHALEGEELELLEDQVRQYEEAVGAPLPAAQDQPRGVVPPLPQRRGDQAFRAHGQDFQLTFNKASWISPHTSVGVWFPEGGARLVAKFQAWALETFPQLFREPLQHTSLTLEESCHAAGGQNRVHLHAQFTFSRRVDRTSLNDFMFDGVRPHVAAQSKLSGFLLLSL